MDRTTVWLEREKRDRIIKITGIPFSEWLRNQVNGYLKDADAIAAGETQIDPQCFDGGTAA